MNEYRVIFKDGKIYAGLAVWRKDGWHWIEEPSEVDDDAFNAVMEYMLDLYNKGEGDERSWLLDDGRDVTLTLTVKNVAKEGMTNG